MVLTATAHHQGTTLLQDGGGTRDQPCLAFKFPIQMGKLSNYTICCHVTVILDVLDRGGVRLIHLPRSTMNNTTFTTELTTDRDLL